MNEFANNMEGGRMAEAIDREVANVVGSYNFSAQASVSLLGESENRVYLVNDPELSQKYVLRVNSGRLSYHNPPSVTSELMWLTALRQDTDIIVPDVLCATDGSTVKTITATDLDKPRHVAVYSFLPGIEPPEDQLVSGFERLGEISARMHLHSRAWTPDPAFDRHFWTPATILDDQLNWGRWQDGVGIKGEVQTLLSRLEDVVRRRLAGLPRDRERFGLIHADLRLANLLVDGDTTSIIDFDDCGFGWYLFDLASALSFLEERPDVPELIDAWLTGYRKLAAIPADIEAELPTLIMLRRLALIGWVGYQQNHLVFARDIGVGFTEDSCRLADDYLKKFS